MDLKQKSKECEAYIIERRRFYHAHPELSGEEANTARSIADDLRAIGVDEVKMLKNHHGIIATIKGGKPGKTVALRADIDALCTLEQTGLPFASENKGAMHACGHDTHIAMLLGAAKMLTEVKTQLPGNVRLLVQPAEEIASGANWMIEEGAMEGVDAVYGNHVWGTYEKGKVNVAAGKRMAGCDLFTITIEGASAHCSAPHLGADAILAAANVLMALQAYVSRLCDPLEPLVLSIGTINGGVRFNTIANKVVMEGTVRYFSSALPAEKEILKIAQEASAPYHCTASLDYAYKTLPVINDSAELNAIAEGAVEKVLGKDANAYLPPMMGSEDFSAYTAGCNVPGVFAFIGTKDEAHPYINHHEKYDLDESVLAPGSAVMAQFAADYLGAK